MTRGRLRVYLGAAPGVGKTFAMLDEGHRRAERGTDVVVGFVETHGRAHTADKLDGLEVMPRALGHLPRSAVHRARPAPPSSRERPEVALVDELAHTNVDGSRERETLAGRPGAARRRHRRDQHGERPAPRVAQRHRRGDHRRAAARDRARRGRARGRADRARRHDPRGAAPADGARQHLRARQGRRGAGQLLPAGQPHRAARAGPALARRQRRGRAAALPRTARHHRDLGDPRADRGRADRRARGRHLDPARRPDRGPGQRRRPARRARRAQRRAGRRRASPPSIGSGCWSNRSAAATTRSSATTCRTPCSTSRGPPTRPRSCIGASRRNPLRRRADRVGHRRDDHPARPGSIDVHMVTHDYVGKGRLLPHRATGGVTGRRRLAGLVCALRPARDHHRRSDRACASQLSFESDLCIYLLMRGHHQPGRRLLPGAGGRDRRQRAAQLLLRRHRSTRSRSTSATTSSRWSSSCSSPSSSRGSSIWPRGGWSIAARASAEAETLSTLAGSLLRGEQALPALLERVRETFGMRGGQPAATALEPADAAGRCWPASGPTHRPRPASADCVAEIDDQQVLAAQRSGAAGRGSARAGRVRRPGRGRLPAARARRRGPRGRAAGRVRTGPHRAAQCGRPRPAHADRVGQGGGVEPARRRRHLERRPTATSCSRPPTMRSTG